MRCIFFSFSWWATPRLLRTFPFHWMGAPGAGGAMCGNLGQRGRATPIPLSGCSRFTDGAPDPRSHVSSVEPFSEMRADASLRCFGAGTLRLFRRLVRRCQRLSGRVGVYCRKCSAPFPSTIWASFRDILPLPHARLNDAIGLGDWQPVARRAMHIVINLSVVARNHLRVVCLLSLYVSFAFVARVRL